MFSIMVVPFYIYSNCVEGFQFLHILVSTCWLLLLLFLSTSGGAHRSLLILLRGLYEVLGIEPGLVRYKAKYLIHCTN